MIISASPSLSSQAVTLPITMTDGKWHHVCITWTTRDGVWEAYQDGVKKGSGQNLSAWRPIEPGGAFILGQEQVCRTAVDAGASAATRMSLLRRFKLRLLFSPRTRWGGASTSPSPLWESCRISSSGPECCRPARSPPRPPAGATSSVMSCPGPRSQWSSTGGLCRCPLTPATKASESRRVNPPPPRTGWRARSQIKHGDLFHWPFCFFCKYIYCLYFLPSPPAPPLWRLQRGGGGLAKRSGLQEGRHHSRRTEYLLVCFIRKTFLQFR